MSDGLEPVGVVLPASAGGEASSVGVIYEALRDAIVRGELSAGEVVSQAALGERFHAPYTPLREALRLLRHEGLVESESGRGVRIAGLSVEELEELQLMRIALETAAVRLTVPRLQRRELGELAGLLAQMNYFLDHRDPELLEVPHRAFHAGLVSGAGPRSQRLMSQLYGQSARYRRAFASRLPESFHPQRYAEHQAILEAAEAGDGPAAAAALTAHYANIAVAIIAVLDPGYTPHDLLQTTGAEGIFDSFVKGA